MAPSRASAVREGGGEASVGVHAGQAIEPCNQHSSGCRRSALQRKATSPVALSRVAGGPCAVGEPVHAWSFHAREPRGLALTRLWDQQAGRSGKAKAVILRCTSARSRTAP
jgi:hypothetical protein